REQFVQKHAQAVDITARIDINARHHTLLRTHVRGRANELLECSEQCLIGQPSLCRFGDSEINYLWHSRTVVDRHENVGWFKVAMDDSFLVRVLDRPANQHKQVEPRSN